MTYSVWTRKDRHIYAHSDCLICGHAYGICSGERKAHRPSKCLACGSPQCWTHGMGRGQCAICYVGLLDAFTPHKCGYSGCANNAVAAAPRVRFACVDHLDRKTPHNGGKATLAQYIVDALAERDKAWELITFDMDSMPILGA